MTRITRLVPIPSGFIALDTSGYAIAYGRSALEIIGQRYGDGWREAEKMVQARLHSERHHYSIHKAGAWEIKIEAGITRSLERRKRA
jgi:hypothetical protein